MSQWKNDDSAANSVLWGVSGYKVAANAANRNAFFGNTTNDAFITGLDVGQFGVDTTEMGVTSGALIEGLITFAGSGYGANAAITLSGGGGSSGVANAQAGATGRIAAINISTAGSSYETNPTVVIAAPTAVTSLTMRNGATPVTNASKFVRTSTVLTLTATAIAEAASYTWTLPTGVTQLSGGTSNIITVNLSGVDSGVASPLVFKVKASNVYGTTADRELSLAATAPAMVSKVVNFGLTTTPDSVDGGVSSNGDTKQYTITASLLANTYIITAPQGCVVTSANQLTNTLNTLETADLDFTVVYPAGYTSTTAAPKTLSVVAKNGVGSSAPKSYVVKSYTPSTARLKPIVTKTEIYPNPVFETLNIDLTSETRGELQVTIYSYVGAIVSETKTINLQEGTNSINIDVSTLNKGIYFVRFTDSVNEEVIVKKIIKN
jgi:hypothetical protein